MVLKYLLIGSYPIVSSGIPVPTCINYMVALADWLQRIFSTNPFFNWKHFPVSMEYEWWIFLSDASHFASESSTSARRIWWSRYESPVYWLVSSSFHVYVVQLYTEIPCCHFAANASSVIGSAWLSSEWYAGYTRPQPIYTVDHFGWVTGPEYGRGNLPLYMSVNLHPDSFGCSPVKS